MTNFKDFVFPPATDDELLELLFPDNEAIENYKWWMRTCGYFLQQSVHYVDTFALKLALEWWMKSLDTLK